MARGQLHEHASHGDVYVGVVWWGRLGSATLGMEFEIALDSQHSGRDILVGLPCGKKVPRIF